MRSFRASAESFAEVLDDQRRSGQADAGVEDVVLHGVGPVGEAVAALDRPGHHVVWGVSDNGPGWFPLGPGHAIGFHPQDDAVRRATERDGVAPPEPERDRILAGIFADEDHPLGGEW